MRIENAKIHSYVSKTQKTVNVLEISFKLKPKYSEDIYYTIAKTQNPDVCCLKQHL